MSSSDEGGDEYVAAVRRLLRYTIRTPAAREVMMMIVIMIVMMMTLDQSGAMLGPLCRPSIVSSVRRGRGGSDHSEPDVLGEKCVS